MLTIYIFVYLYLIIVLIVFYVQPVLYFYKFELYFMNLYL